MFGKSSGTLSWVVEKVNEGGAGARGNRRRIRTCKGSNRIGTTAKAGVDKREALGNITMDDYDATDLSGMMEKVTSGATGALGNISMFGYSSDTLSSTGENVTAGATGAMGNITGMTSFDASYLTGMMVKVTSGATGALGNITMDD